jgi:hypothetical protein
VLGGPRVAGAAERWDSHSYAAEEEELREEAAQLAVSFFSLAPAERQRRWRALAERCTRFPLVAGRIRELAAGLDVDPGAVADADPLVQQLAEKTAELFVLGFAARAEGRKTMLSGMRLAIGPWEAAARRLERQYPKVAALEPDLVSRLANWTATHGRRKRVRLPSAAAHEATTFGQSVKPWSLPVAIVIALLLYYAAFYPKRSTSTNPFPGDEQHRRIQEIIKQQPWNANEEQRHQVQEWIKHLHDQRVPVPVPAPESKREKAPPP